MLEALVGTPSYKYLSAAVSYDSEDSGSDILYDRDSNSETGKSDNETYNVVYEPYEDEPLAAEIDAAEDQETNEETDIDGLTPFILEQRYERSVSFDSWYVLKQTNSNVLSNVL